MFAVIFFADSRYNVERDRELDYFPWAKKCMGHKYIYSTFVLSSLDKPYNKPV